jgi:RNA polymerase sigma-70 factor (ECF subfamily)
MDLVAEVRPELHRYCARITGSVFDGEDVVQDTLAKAHYALGQMTEPPPLRPWLFRIAHNTAMDFLRRYEHRHVDLVAEVPDGVDADAQESGVDPALVEAALAVFVTLPPVQRSALVLKDVLGHSLEQTATTMGTTVSAVKAALVRARANIAAGATVPRAEPPKESAEARANLQRYADLFNARDWQGLRALLGEESRLDLVSRNQRRGAAVAEYYSPGSV